MEKPIIGITMGDPSGNGPELSVKALMNEEVYKKCRPFIVGDAICLEEAKKVVPEAKDWIIYSIGTVENARFQYGCIDVLDMGLVELDRRLYQKDRREFEKKNPDFADVDAMYKESRRMCGKAAFQYVVKVIDLAKSKKVDGTVTNALNKNYMNLAGYHYSGHTEIYAEYTGTKNYSMMLAHGDLRVAHVSTHVSLREACNRVKKDRVLQVIRMADKACKDMGIDNPRISVAGLNPHCGEDGLFGREEAEEIQPAIDAALSEGIHIPDRKPVPADTVFSKALGGWYDIVVVMYHDQGHIPLKVVGFVYDKDLGKWSAIEGINVTLGLPIIRASVDHGTGEDRAGDGSANELSLLHAIDYAARMAANMNKSQIV